MTPVVYLLCLVHVLDALSRDSPVLQVELLLLRRMIDLEMRVMWMHVMDVGCMVKNDMY